MSDTQIDKYLFNEMPEAEREKFEDAFVGDDALFYEIAERENELVDRYSRGEMADDERVRFERSVGDNPARRKKIENAKILREFIADEKPATKMITIAERSGFFSRFFSFGPALQFASVGLIAILALASVLLWTENRRLGSLQQELAASRQRESDLAAKMDDESETSSALTTDLDAERRKREELEAEIAKLRNTLDHPPTNGAPQTTIAALALPSIGIRDGSPPVRVFKLSSSISRVSIVAGVRDVRTGEDVSVQLNDEVVAGNTRVKNRSGEQSISLTIPVSKLKLGRNELVIRDTRNEVVASYIIAVTKVP